MLDDPGAPGWAILEHVTLGLGRREFRFQPHTESGDYLKIKSLKERTNKVLDDQKNR